MPSAVHRICIRRCRTRGERISIWITTYTSSSLTPPGQVRGLGVTLRTTAHATPWCSVERYTVPEKTSSRHRCRWQHGRSSCPTHSNSVFMCMRDVEQHARRGSTAQLTPRSVRRCRSRCVHSAHSPDSGSRRLHCTAAHGYWAGTGPAASATGPVRDPSPGTHVRSHSRS